MHVPTGPLSRLLAIVRSRARLAALAVAVVMAVPLLAACGDDGRPARFSHRFTQDGWATIEKFWFVGTPGSNYPERRICVEPYHPLRLVVAGTVKFQSNSGCINYGGRTALAHHEVQVQGKAGEQIVYHQGNAGLY